MKLDHNDPNDCPDCTYGPEFIDDGVPTRHVLKHCPECAEGARKALDHIVAHKLAQSPPPAGEA